MRARAWWLWSAFVLAWLPCVGASAHKPSDSYLKIATGGEELSVLWDIALKDLEFLVGLDADGDGQITWGELKAQRAAVADYALSRLRITADGEPCDLRLAELLFTRHSDGGYAVLDLALDSGTSSEKLANNPRTLTVTYDLLFDLDPTHRGLVLYDEKGVASTHVLSPGSRTVELRAGEAGHWSALCGYTVEGVWHIWIGFDHILFLLCLLLPAVWTRREKKWEPVTEFRPAFRAVLKIVTVFTLAHSITLWLSVTEVFTLPARMVEATIAFSIILTALHNLRPVFPLPGWAIAFGFGLIHGFGFANVLLDLGLTDATLAVSLLGFNVGVELGQLAIVLVFVPPAYLLRHTRFYRWGIFYTGSVLVALLAALWMVERVFNLELVGI